MGLNNRLQIGDVSNNGQVEIVDEDRLCYLVRSTSRGAFGLRTISKSLLEEYVNYWSEHSNATSESARQALSGTSEIDKFEYGYTSTLSVMAQMVLQSTHNVNNKVSCLPLQQIFYGAPGTGKSFTINQEIKGEDVIRTTFHPDSDYSSFVGAYKPTTREITMRDLSGNPVIERAQILTEEKIVYEFVPQAFLQAYIEAWEKYAACDEGNPQRQFLVIEEINRGNCAQVFGDLFQLLDRNDRGFSDYPVKADSDMKRYLAKAFKGQSIPQVGAINSLYGGRDVVSEVLEGNILLLPSNLFIWATMNTSDQSLFPIDSAFKRRWEWEYVPIRNEAKGWVIAADGQEWDWWQFLNAVNEKIGSITDSEDKKLGYYFVKPADGHTITAKTFVGKVLFYLWNDVFKDYGFSDDEFQTEEGKEMKYPMFYEAEGGKDVNEPLIARFLSNLKLKTVDAADVTAEEITAEDNEA
jgi:conserved domain protein